MTASEQRCERCGDPVSSGSHRTACGYPLRPITVDELAGLQATYDAREVAATGYATVARLLNEIKRLGGELNRCVGLNHDLVNENVAATTCADAAERKLAEALDALTVAAELIDRLTDDGTCDYGHHDNCRTHSLQKRPCSHPLGWQFVEAWRAVEAEQKEAADDAHQ